MTSLSAPPSSLAFISSIVSFIFCVRDECNVFDKSLRKFNNRKNPFEEHYSISITCPVSSVVERWTFNPTVVGSTPTSGEFFYRDLLIDLMENMKHC